jgi:hypothetical protein
MKKAYIVKINGVRGFCGTTYVVRNEEKILKIFEKKQDAIKYAEIINK